MRRGTTALLNGNLRFWVDYGQDVGALHVIDWYNHQSIYRRAAWPGVESSYLYFTGRYNA